MNHRSLLFLRLAFSFVTASCVTLSNATASSRCAEAGFSQSLNSDKNRSARSHQQIRSFFNTFDYSKSYTEEEARAEIHARLGDLTWSAAPSDFAEATTAKTLNEMIAITRDIAFGPAKKRQSWIGKFKYQRQVRAFEKTEYPPFDDSKFYVSQKIAARGVLKSLLRLKALKSENPNLSYFDGSLFQLSHDSAIAFGWLMSFHRSPLFQKPYLLSQRYGLHKSTEDFQKYFGGQVPSSYFTFDQYDLLDLLLLSSVGHLPHWVTRNAFEKYDGWTHLAKEVTQHDFFHSEIQVDALNLSQSQLRQVRDFDFLNLERKLTAEMLVTAMAQPTAIRRVMAITALFDTKHESGIPLVEWVILNASDFLSSDERELSAQMTPAEVFISLTNRFGEYRGFGRVELGHFSATDFTAVFEDLSATYRSFVPLNVQHAIRNKPPL